MNITYLIGNGFDIGLGLKTDYRSFLDWYLRQPNESPEVGWLKEQILKDTELWSDAELAFGAFIPNSGYSCSYRARMYERAKCRVFASLFDRTAGLREAIESVDAPRITVLHPQKVKDGIGRVSPCDFFKLKYFYQKFVKERMT